MMTLRNRAAPLCVAAHAGAWRRRACSPSPTCPAARTTVRPRIGRSSRGRPPAARPAADRAPPSRPRAPRVCPPRRSPRSPPRRATPASPRAPPSGGARVAVRSSTVERPRATARPVGARVWKQLLDATQRNSAKPPSSPPAPSTPGPSPARTCRPRTRTRTAPRSTWNVNGPDARLAGRAGQSVQPAASTGLAARLEPYIAGSGATSSSTPTRPTARGATSSCTTAPRPSGNYDEIDREHRKLLGYDGCGYHFVIGNGNGSGDGQIEVAQRWNNQKQGVHCRNARSHDVDEYGIGICLVGDLDQQPPTPRQVAATQALVAYLSQRYRHRPRPRLDPRASRRDAHRLPGQVLPGPP